MPICPKSISEIICITLIASIKMLYARTVLKYLNVLTATMHESGKAMVKASAIMLYKAIGKAKI